MKSRGQDTSVKNISIWRESSRSALDMIQATWKLGDPPVKTHMQQLAFLAYGSPTLRYALYLAATKIFRDPNCPYHRKLLIGEALPLSAWFMEMVIQHAYIGVAVMNSGLTQSQRSDVAKKFNNPKSDLQVLILLADVSIVGLNLQEACSAVYLTSINLASEIQLWGRAIQVRR